MAYSIRAQRVVAERARQRRAAQAAAEQAAHAAADAYHAAYLDRERAADVLGISVHKFKRLVLAGKGPVCVKNGTAKQATVRWPLEELTAYKSDPAAYVAARRSSATGDAV